MSFQPILTFLSKARAYLSGVLLKIATTFSMMTFSIATVSKMILLVMLSITEQVAWNKSRYKYKIRKNYNYSQR
jgi:hypothetical protein